MRHIVRGLHERSSLLRPNSAIFSMDRRYRTGRRMALGQDNRRGHADHGGVLRRYFASATLGDVHHDACPFLPWILHCRQFARCDCCRSDNTPLIEFNERHGNASGF